MSKHTIGDWFVADDLTIRSKVWGNSDQMADYKGVIIADLKPALGAESDEDVAICRPHARAETNANAYLIAAAARMYAALKMIADDGHKVEFHRNKRVQHLAALARLALTTTKPPTE